MKFSFRSFDFSVNDGRVSLLSAYGISQGGGFAEVQVCGENKDSHLGVKTACSSEGARLRYVSHELTEDRLVIRQQSDIVGVKTVFVGYDDTDTVRIYTEVKNLTNEDIVIEEASSFVLPSVNENGIDSARKVYFTKFTQSHHAECQPRRASLYDFGLFRGNAQSQKRLAFSSVGSWSTKEELPQLIIEDSESCRFIMAQIESSTSWYYELADNNEKYYLWLGGATLPFGGWSTRLAPNATFTTPAVALAFSDSVNGVIGEMTKYRRHIAARGKNDLSLPTIFNEYMHLSWDSPTEENTRAIAPVVASCGVKYYVIDCGWHDEVPGCEVYPYVGKWRESNARFPHGVRKTTDYIRSLGMKAGLWIEPEIIGIKCTEMLDYYTDDCFLQRHGKKIAVMNRYFLDFRAKRVRDYIAETLRIMIEEYGADYIKCDYNEDVGVGTDYLALCAAEGLYECGRAYIDFMRSMTKKYPEVIFEGCASGGMRMDYNTLSAFSLVSTSDQVDYLKYPYIAANVLSAVIPEQAAVWSYPVGAGIVGLPFDKDADWVHENIDADRTAMNMINSLLGRMHLASHIEMLSEECLELVKEGVRYYDSITEVKKRALPYFPMGFASFGDPSAAAGFISDDKIYLAVWCLGGEPTVNVKLGRVPKNARIAYPKSSPASITLDADVLTAAFTGVKQAIFVEIEL